MPYSVRVHIYLTQRSPKVSGVFFTSTLHALDIPPNLSCKNPLVGNTFVDHSNAVAASSVNAAQTTSSMHSRLYTCFQYIAQRQLQNETRNISVLGFDATYITDLTVLHSLHCCIYLGHPDIFVTGRDISSLTQLPQDNMAAISQTIFSDAFLE